MTIQKKILLMLVIVTIVAAATTLYEYSQDDGVEIKAHELTATASTEVSQSEIVVYVSGAVNNPGVVTVADGSRVADAVEQCGGMLPTADTNAVNMAQTLKDGTQIRIPEKNVISSAADTANSVNTGNGDMVNINQADVKALEALPGIGPAMAQRIVDYRNSNGSFQSIDDLKKVKGIGKAKFEKLKDRVTV